MENLVGKKETQAMPAMFTDKWWAYIVRTLVDDKRLTDGAKTLYLHIAESIANESAKNGWKDVEYCKSNSELATELNLSVNGASAFVTKLYKAGYIDREIFRDEKNVLKRRIRLLEV